MEQGSHGTVLDKPATGSCVKITLSKKRENFTSGEEGADHETKADSSHRKYKEEDED